MKTRKRFFRQREEGQNFWPSFTDVMSTIALVLFFLMLIAYIQNIVTGKNLEFVRQEVALQEENLRLLRDEVDRTKAEVEKGRRELRLSEQEIENQQRIIAESNLELGNLRSKLQSIAVLRVETLKKVKESIENEMGATNDEGQELVSIGENANIIINESVMFDFDSSEIKPAARRLLRQFAIAFENILDDVEVRENIDTISIDGHADKTGTYSRNAILSSERANNVLRYIMESNPDLERKYSRYFAASGYSESRPLDPGDSEAARQKNRRIEISINIKDSNVQNIINEYLHESSRFISGVGKFVF
jgi:chemotaxis protein MotB